MRGRVSEKVGARIGELARGFGLNPRTLRYYESVGLLRPRRTASGYRVYDDRDRDRLRFVLRAKRAGLTLREMAEILTLWDRGEAPCGYVRGWLERGLREVEAQLRALRVLRQELGRLRRRAARRPRGEPPCVCPILEEARDGSGPSAWRAG
ncbi:MAG: MerR family transcriptional regulator [Armatimonadota bacterium]|nr:MerR family transcriptional regulator [Armatimonadota bacterium]MDR7476301.1 MerR family transcriptional regulator [Armatimonadota bacterium]MDR7525663.1 MerR family transcriptional regulator [Armatimonadota bacterium]MDR7565179.1 MerR family transcriptional regulator [Armatimonadota bacterium]MDR7579505.1 MerR family transcriptional regulator [Armatimonadota bacterium]